MSGIYVKENNVGKEVANTESGGNASVKLYNLDANSTSSYQVFNCSGMGEKADNTMISIMKVGNMYNGSIQGGVGRINGISIESSGVSSVTFNVTHALLGITSTNKPKITVTSGASYSLGKQDCYCLGSCGWNSATSGYATLHNVYNATTAYHHIIGNGNMNLDETDSTTLANKFGITLPV